MLAYSAIYAIVDWCQLIIRYKVDLFHLSHEGGFIELPFWVIPENNIRILLRGRAILQLL